MADEIILKTWAAATVAPVDDAVIQEVYTGDGGIISGATVTIKDANTLHITGGYGAICGREFQIFASDIPVVLSSSGNLNGRLYIHMDLSQSTNPIQLLTEVAASLTPCVQDADVNLTNGIFEINLATFTVGTSAISGLADVAPKLVGIESSDLTSIKAVGSTNATGSTITKGTYFYLNGKLCLAKSDIANGATFTLNTNYEVVTAGGLNSLNSALTANYNLGTVVDLTSYTGSTKYTIPKDGYLNIQFGTGNAVLAYAGCWIEGNNESVHVYLQAYANNNKGANLQGELVQVKKGFKISAFSCDNSAANAKLYYMPFDAV